MISQALRIHESTVARHLSDYVLSEKLKPENGGSQSRLSAGQTMQLIEHLTEKTYFHTHQIVAYVQAEFGIRIREIVRQNLGGKVAQCIKRKFDISQRITTSKYLYS